MLLQWKRLSFEWRQWLSLVCAATTSSPCAEYGDPDDEALSANMKILKIVLNPKPP